MCEGKLNDAIILSDIESSSSKSVTVNNYYTGEDIDIPLDPMLSAIENAKKYYDKYNKLKRTYELGSSFVPR